MITRPALASLLLALGLVATACDSSDCDPGQTYRDGLCYPDPDAAPAEGTADAGTDAADAGTIDAGAADAAVDAFAHYGDVCEETAECEAPSNYCAIQPGETVGYCTHTGCVEDASVCPDDWSCLDLSVFDPTLPSICTPP